MTELSPRLVEELAGRGVHVATIARAIGVNKDTFRSCRGRQPEVDASYHAGIAHEHDPLVGNLCESEALEANLSISINKRAADAAENSPAGSLSPNPRIHAGLTSRK